MNIGHASRRTGLAAKTIRYYEDMGLVAPARGDNGYRDYSVADIERLQFLRRSRALGFSVEECRRLLSLRDDGSRESADVKLLAQAKLAEIDRRMEELAALRASLAQAVSRCHGDARPDCPIIDGLAGGNPLQ
ncbi:MAG: Cu(I)-responsive transcriptional regulator [Mesorhizobium amorphae]|nr:MAG: Cu(I)-responsive transcriptional regulator [Mesorhizobium amorphae]